MRKVEHRRLIKKPHWANTGAYICVARRKIALQGLSILRCVATLHKKATAFCESVFNEVSVDRSRIQKLVQFSKAEHFSNYTVHTPIHSMENHFFLFANQLSNV